MAKKVSKKVKESENIDANNVVETINTPDATPVTEEETVTEEVDIEETETTDENPVNEAIEPEETQKNEEETDNGECEVKFDKPIEDVTSEEIVEKYNEVSGNINDKLENVGNGEEMEEIIGDEIGRLNELENIVDKKIESINRKNTVKNNKTFAKFWCGVSSGWD